MSTVISSHVKDKNRIFTGYEIFVTGKILVFRRCLYNKRFYKMRLTLLQFTTSITNHNKLVLQFTTVREWLCVTANLPISYPKTSGSWSAGGRRDRRWGIRTGGSDELASSAGSRCLAIVTSRREKRASLPSLQKWRWQTDVRVWATNVFFCY